MYGVHDPAKLARAYSLPPGTPDAHVAMLRKALAATVTDPAFAAEANSQGLEIRPLDGAAIEETVKRLFALDPKFIVQLRKLLFPEKPAGEKQAP
jgi:tripartite-type tricarboxylate transporter receptor subunit TctC